MEGRFLAMVLCVGMVVAGLYLSMWHYQDAIHPLTLAEDDLRGMVASSDHLEIMAHLENAKHNLATMMDRLPESKNPVWLFPTESTNFLRIENDVDTMIASVGKISAVPNDSSAYRVGVLDVHHRADAIRENIADAKGFMYASAANVSFTLVWVLGAAGLAVAWSRK